METTLPPMNPEVARLRRQSAQRKLRKRLRHARLLWLVAALCLLVLLGEVIIALLCSPRFWIYRITVRNLETLTKPEVIQLMQLPPHSNFHRVSLGALARRIATDPRVDHAQVQRGAVGVLTVAVQERQPVCQLGHTIPPLYMDAHGYLFTRPVPPETPVPVVDGVPLRGSLRRVLGTRVTSIPATAVLDCLESLRKPSGAEALEITRITVTPRGWLNLVLRQGTLVFIGPADDLAFKADCITSIIAKASGGGHALEQINYINVRFANRDTGVAGTFATKNDQEETVEP